MNNQGYILEIIDELSLVFWLSIFLISPVFSILEVLVQEFITKMIYFLTNKLQLAREKVQKIGFNSTEKLQNIQNLHSEYEKKKTLSEKLKISEDFLDETRGGMFLLNEMSEKVMGEIRTHTSEDNYQEDNYFFDRNIITKQDFSIRELEGIKVAENNDLDAVLIKFTILHGKLIEAIELAQDPESEEGEKISKLEKKEREFV